MKEVLIQEYNSTKILNIPYKEPQNVFNVNFVDGAFLEITGPEDKEYKVLFINQDNDQILHSTTIKNNIWSRTNIKYFINWLVQVYCDNELVFEHKFNPEGKRVYIHLDSKAIGDTLAWFPYVDEFRKKWNCQVITSTFHNDWFKDEYPELEFITPGTEVFDLYAMYSIGWHYESDAVVNYNKVPRDFKTLNLQETSTDILGLEYTEVVPKITLPKGERTIKEKYVVIAPHASAHAKYWNYPGGWQTIINHLNKKGYKVVMITQEPWGDSWHDSKLGSTLKNIINKTGDFPIEERMIDIKHADAFIGVGSGLSWLAWAIGTPVVLISGFSYPHTEFKSNRVFPKNPSICTGCFNREWLNPGDWDWCPDHKGTPRQFECTKSITPNMVIGTLQETLNIY